FLYTRKKRNAESRVGHPEKAHPPAQLLINKNGYSSDCVLFLVFPSQSHPRSFCSRFPPMATKSNPSSLFPSVILLLLLHILPSLLPAVQGGQRKFHITDDLRDVVDDEEDEAWKEWGKKKTDDEFDPPPSDMSNMAIEEIQEAFLKRTTAPVFGFVKLRVGVKRTPVNLPDSIMF
ncbi:hypothetical protein LINGRAHAP2_LOCUS14800, partial [Linum grandiflorum]